MKNELQKENETLRQIYREMFSIIEDVNPNKSSKEFYDALFFHVVQALKYENPEVVIDNLSKKYEEKLRGGPWDKIEIITKQKQADIFRQLENLRNALLIKFANMAMDLKNKNDRRKERIQNKKKLPNKVNQTGEAVGAAIVNTLKGSGLN